jgi:hypothetical protein
MKYLVTRLRANTDTVWRNWNLAEGNGALSVDSKLGLDAI